MQELILTEMHRLNQWNIAGTILFQKYLTALTQTQAVRL